MTENPQNITWFLLENCVSRQDLIHCISLPLSLCLSDPLRALELRPYSLKPLLRRAMAYDSLERYHKAYVDYKTVLQIDTGVQAAHDSVHRSGSSDTQTQLQLCR